MSDQEKRQQRVQLRIEVEDARQNLADLQERALRIADELEAVADKTRSNANLEPSKADFTSEADVANRIDPCCQSSLNYGNLLRLIEGLKQARQKVFNLRLRESRLVNGGT
jgi:Zn-dependent oligopeptidase